jgi:predicted metal-binding protein
MEAAITAGVRVHEQALLPVGELVFSPQLLEYCKSNVCGRYNNSWTCPPACGSMEEQREKILCYQYTFVFTTMHKLEDSFDYEGMMHGKELHTSLTSEFKKRLTDVPVYGAGSCSSCERCAFPSPCLFPEKKIGSIEAAGINVTELSKAAGVAYNNGPNTVTYFSMALLKQIQE